MSQDPIFPNTNPHVQGKPVPFFPNVDESVKPWKKRGRGHPTKYKGEETIRLTYEYLDECEDRYQTVPIFDENGERVKYKTPNQDTGEREEKTRTIFQTAIPTIAGLAIYLGVNSDTIYTWRDAHPEYSEIVKLLLNIQETRLVQGAMSGLYSPKTANLMLSSNFGYTDKKVVEHQGLTLSDLHSAKKETEQ